MGPVLEAVRGLGAELGRLSLSPLSGALRPLLPELADALPPALEPLGDAAAERHRVFRALVEVLGATGPAVLVLEDLHWSDPEQTPEFLRFLIDEQPSGLTVVVTFRGEEVTEDLRAAITRPPTESTSVRLVLGPLDQAGTRQLTAAILEAGQVSDGFATYLHETTDGVPFAVEEMLALLRERGAVTQHEGRWERQMLSSIGVPAAIAEAVAERVTRLSPEAQNLVEAAAVLEAAAPDVVVLAVADLAGSGAGAGAIVEAVQAGIVIDQDGAIGFRHVLATQAVYEGLPTVRRRELHSRAADALAETQPCPLGQLVHHLEHAGRVREWAVAAEAAADQAVRLRHEDEAARLLEDVLRRAFLDPDRRGRLAVKLGRAGSETLLPRHATLSLLSEALEYDQCSEVRGELRFWLAIASQQAGRGLPREALAGAVDDLSTRPDLRAWAMVALGIPNADDVVFTEHTMWLQRGLGALGDVSDPALHVLLLGKAAMALAMLGDRSWRELVERMRDHVGGIPRRPREVNAYESVAMVTCYQGDHCVTDQLLTAATAGNGTLESKHLQQRVERTRVLLDYCRGAWDGLSDACRSLLDELPGNPVVRADVELVAGLLALADGEVRCAEQTLSAAADRAKRASEQGLLAMAVGSLARIAVVSGNFGDAVEDVRSMVAVFEGKGIWAPITRALPAAMQLLVAAGEGSEGRGLLDRASAELCDLDAPLAPAALEHARGVLGSADERWADAAEHFLAAAELYEPLQCPYEAAQAREQAALAMFEAEDPRAEDTLRAALATYQRLGATWDLARCARAGRERGVSLPVPHRRGRTGYGDRLSPREEEIAQLAAEGLTNKDIAEQLFLAPATVDGHLGRAMRKLGVHSRRKLAVLLDRTRSR